MTRMEEALVSAWSGLTPDQAGNGIGTMKVGIELDGGGVRVGMDGYGARHLLIPLAEGAVPADRRSGGVVLVGQELQVGSERQLFADLVCIRPELNDVFGALAADICEALDEHGEAPIKVVLRGLERWRQLLGPSRTAGEWTISAAVGLHGELLILERILDEGGENGLAAWTGPDRLHHDFRRGRLAVEVKTTTAREGLRVEIHGLEQLDTSADIELALVVVRLISDPAGETLPEVVDRLVSRVTDAGVLMDRLAGSGYEHGQTPAPEHAGDWPRYVRSDVQAWWVDDDFPVIRRDQLPADAPAAIERLRYTVNLAAAGAPIEDDRLSSVLAELGSS